MCLRLLAPLAPPDVEGLPEGRGLLSREFLMVDDRTTNEGSRVRFTGLGRVFDSIIRSRMLPVRSPINLLF